MKINEMIQAAQTTMKAFVARPDIQKIKEVVQVALKSDMTKFAATYAVSFAAITLTQKAVIAKYGNAFNFSIA